ncbi:VOC family protein [Nocardiopsis quinghaiensis]|uniref:VOC family protein n=1 Tax=Nocardiopsis quinghaiensis TaxID=464995 RepID=UPI00123C00BE|nr:VOC family protein [Nocardiopsis quinghaiensis]
MDIELVGLAVLCDDPGASAGWFTEHFGFEVGIDLGWYLNTRHGNHPKLSVDFVLRDHPSTHEVLRDGRAKSLVAFLVPDVDAEERRLREAGVEVVMPLVSEPWGQRRFQVSGPEGLYVELLQMVAPDPEWMRDNGSAVEAER